MKEIVIQEKNDLTKIASNGWKQGSCLLIPNDLSWEDRNGAKLKSGLYVLVSQDCDIVNPNIEKEPYVEFLYVEKTKHNGELSNGKNPRKLHIQINQDSNEFYVECLPYNRDFLCKKNLFDLFPCGYVAERELRILINWLAKRYTRPAFPNAFNNRVKNVYKKIQKIMKELAFEAEGLYIQLDRDKELEETESYKVSFFLLFSNEVFRDKLDDGAEKIFNCLDKVSGIKVINYRVLSKQEIYLSQFEESKEMDFDFLSYITNP